MQRHRLIFDALLLLFHEYITPPAAFAVDPDLDTLVIEEDPVSSDRLSDLVSHRLVSVFSYGRWYNH